MREELKPFLSTAQTATLRASMSRQTPQQAAKDFLEKNEFDEFLEIVQRRRLDPFTGQIYWTKRWNKDAKRYALGVEATIDGLRLIAERTGKYAGQLGPMWCGDDGQWVDVWLGTSAPAAAKVGVLRKDFEKPLWVPANWIAYVQTYKVEGGASRVNAIWSKMGPHMLAKVAEALALRKAFPEETSRLYIREENANEESTPTDAAPADDKPAETTASDAANADGEVLTLQQWRMKVRTEQKRIGIPDANMKDLSHSWINKRQSRDFTIDDCKKVLETLKEKEPAIRRELDGMNGGNPADEDQTTGGAQ